MLVQLGFIFSDESSGSSSGFGWSEAMAFGVVILVMAIMPRIIRKIRSERAALVKQETKAIKNGPNIRSQADKILVELVETSREINAQSDTKIRVLNKLVRDADKAIKRLEDLVEREEALTSQNNGKVVSFREAPETSVVDSAEIRVEQAQLKNTEQSVEQKTQKNAIKDVSEAKPLAPNKDSGVWQDTVGAKISKLHAQGFDINDIARKTRMSVSEVTLILEMSRKNK